jgi:hypothetical protein
LRKFEGKDIAKRSLEEMKRVGKFSADQEAMWLKAMTALFPAVDKGDKLLGVYKPNEGAEFWFNQKRLSPHKTFVQEHQCRSVTKQHGHKVRLATIGISQTTQYQLKQHRYTCMQMV